MTSSLPLIPDGILVAPPMLTGGNRRLVISTLFCWRKCYYGVVSVHSFTAIPRRRPQNEHSWTKPTPSVHGLLSQPMIPSVLDTAGVRRRPCALADRSTSARQQPECKIRDTSRWTH
ncbi:hypothetical protein PsYK624_123580 [Phanerochaete sordida]|uniref:Uncharacterized protein n=1 Tax=Phanerochaete sordida TaxID=48140 RepID=A0A9P3GMF7_9APHY|nr:hypothetical protein PsYK624_123580 [Phanerochaete sordida]